MVNNMKQLMTKLWQAVKDSIKWILIQFAIIFAVVLLHRGGLYIWSLFSDYGFKELLLSHPIGSHSAYGWDNALLIAIPIYTILFSIWHTFINKKNQWWTILIPWTIYLCWVYLDIAKGLDWNIKIITVDEYILAGWLSPLYGALLQGLIIFFQRKKAAKEQEQEYQEMLSSVCGMFNKVQISPETIEKHIRKATEEEVEQLISISKTVPHEKPWPGYYIPSDRNFITYSLENNPDKVYLLKKIEPLKLNDDFLEPPQSYNFKCLEIENMNKDYFVFLFDSFGLPETHLCASRGYALYDPDKKDIVAHIWRWIS